MGFQLVAYNTLKASVEESIRAVLRKHGLDTNNVEESINKLDKPRRIHCQLLRTYVQLLDASSLSDEIKVRVLNGAVYYIRSLVIKEYTYISTNNSILKTSLTTSLAITEENKPSDHDVYNMYLHLSKFLHSKVYKDGDSFKGYLDVQAFSSKRIKNYSVEEDITELVTILYNLKISSIKEAKAKQAKEEADKNPARGFLGIFGAATPQGGAQTLSGAAAP